MKVQCSTCGTNYRIDASKVPGSGVYVRCKACNSRFFISKETPEEVIVPSDTHPASIAPSEESSNYKREPSFAQTESYQDGLKTENQEKLPSAERQGAEKALAQRPEVKGRLPISEFVRHAIIKLREDSNKGILMVKSGFADAFREYYDLDPVREVGMLVEEGKVVTKGEGGDVLIFLPEDISISDTLKRILDSSETSEAEDGKKPVQSDSLKSCELQIAVEESGPDVLDKYGGESGAAKEDTSQVESEKIERWILTGPTGLKLFLHSFEDLRKCAMGRAKEFLAMPGVDQKESQGQRSEKSHGSKDPFACTPLNLVAALSRESKRITNGEDRLQHGAPLVQNGPEEKELNRPRSKIQLLLNEPLTVDSCVRILTIAGFGVEAEKPEQKLPRILSKLARFGVRVFFGFGSAFCWSLFCVATGIQKAMLYGFGVVGFFLLGSWLGRKWLDRPRPDKLAN